MKNAGLRVGCVLIGIACVAYYVALWISEPGSRLFTASFSLIWLVFAAIAFAFSFAGDTILKIARTRIFRRRWTRILTATIVGIFLAISAGILVYICIPVRSESLQDAEYLLVLGVGIRESGEATNGLRARLDTAAAYVQNRPAVTVIVTGGMAKHTPWPEAKTMAQYLRDTKGITDTTILEESKSRDTIQNFTYSAILINERESTLRPGWNLYTDPPAVCVLTSGYHLRRALFLARRIGYANLRWISAPVPALSVPISYLREVGAWWKLGIRLLVTGKPADHTVKK